MLLNPAYCDKVNTEYELIKNSVLHKSADVTVTTNNNESGITIATDVTNTIPSESFTVESNQTTPTAGSSRTTAGGGLLRRAERPEFLPKLDRCLATSTYDNLNETAEDSNGSVDMINDIIAQVMLAQCQSEQLDKIDHVQVDWQCLDSGGTFSADYESPAASVSPSAFFVESEEQSGMQIIDTNFIIINDIVIPKSRDHDTSRLEVSIANGQKGSVFICSNK
jgi:hypothetical protein